MGAVCTYTYFPPPRALFVALLRASAAYVSVMMCLAVERHEPGFRAVSKQLALTLMDRLVVQVPVL
jgi:hypothetical protein